MKCPKCHRTMEYKEYKKDIYYYRCNSCGYSIGKPEEKEETNSPEEKPEMAN